MAGRRQWKLTLANLVAAELDGVQHATEKTQKCLAGILRKVTILRRVPHFAHREDDGEKLPQEARSRADSVAEARASDLHNHVAKA